MNRARAAIHVARDRPLVIDEIEYGDPEEGQVLVKHFASGICHSQIHTMQHPRYGLPQVLGHEATGVVEKAGRGVTHVREGDHVMVTWVPRDARPGAPAPNESKLLYQGKPIASFQGIVTWSERCLAAQEFVVRLDHSFPTDVTAIIGCAVMTGCGAALNTARVRKGDSVAVFGVGGVGLCIVSAAAALGAYPIIAVDLSEEKLAFAKQFGATHGVNAGTGDPVEGVKALSNGGVNYAFDAIGLPITMEQILPATRLRGPGTTGGTAVLVGVPAGPATLDPRDIFSGERRYIGSIGGSCRPDRDFPRFLQWYREGTLRLDELVTARYRLEEINEAVENLDQGRTAGRSIIVY